jgi:hypothetical protein
MVISIRRVSRSIERWRNALIDCPTCDSLVDQLDGIRIGEDDLWFIDGYFLFLLSRQIAVVGLDFLDDLVIRDFAERELSTCFQVFTSRETNPGRSSNWSRAMS